MPRQFLYGRPIIEPLQLQVTRQAMRGDRQGLSPRCAGTAEIVLPQIFRLRQLDIVLAKMQNVNKCILKKPIGWLAQ